MNTVLVWVLISMSNHYSGFVSYSPPFASLDECERVKGEVHSEKLGNKSSKFKSECVKMNIIEKANVPTKIK